MVFFVPQEYNNSQLLCQQVPPPQPALEGFGGGHTSTFLSTLRDEKQGEYLT
jgi:hypothetical protein